MKQAKNTEVVNLNGMTVPDMWVSFAIITFMVMDTICGLMAASTLVNGQQTKCMVTVYFHGRMEKDMKDNIIRIKRKATAYFTGQMEVSTREAGKMASSMVPVPTHRAMAYSVSEHGLTASELHGSMRSLIKIQLQPRTKIDNSKPIKRKTNPNVPKTFSSPNVSFSNLLNQL